MSKLFDIKSVLVTAAVASALGFGGTANAALGTAALQISDGAGNTKTCIDNDVCDASAMDGVIAWVTNLDGWVLNILGGLSKPFIGSAASPAMDLSYNDGYNGGTVAGDNVLTILFSDIGFTGKGNSSSQIGGTFSANVTGVSVTDYASASNTRFDMPGAGLCTQSFTTSPFSGNCLGNYSGATPYSLTEKVVLTATAGQTAQASGDHSLTVKIPEPATLLLIGAGLAGAGFARRRKQA